MENTEYKDYKNYTETPDEFGSAPNEFSSDFIVETDALLPTEFPLPSGGEASASQEDEQAATTDDYNDFNELYNPADEYDYDSETAEEIMDNYDVESADDRNNAYDRELNSVYNTDFYRDTTRNYVDPSDEQASTVNDDYNTACERCKLDDYEIISDVLGSEKEIVKLYSTALCEAAEDNFRTIIKQNLDYAAEDQYKAFEFMNERGMYKTEQATENDIDQAKQQFSPLVRNNNDCGCNPDYEHCNHNAECANDACNIDYENCNCVDCTCDDN